MDFRFVVVVVVVIGLVQISSTSTVAALITPQPGYGRSELAVERNAALHAFGTRKQKHKGRALRLAASTRIVKGENDFSFRYHTLSDVERIFCLSDLHTDHVDNMQWLKDAVASSDLNSNDLLIVAGDISHELSTFSESLTVLRSKGSQVIFVPGNHEAWLNSHEKDQFDSLEKFRRVAETCIDYGRYVDPVYVDGEHPLWIVPLQSWYDGSLSISEELCEGWMKWPWVDFIRARWPEDQFPKQERGSPNARIPKGLAEYLVNTNEPILKHVRDDIIQRKNNPTEKTQKTPCLMTMSHFLPNKQCIPDWKDVNADEFDFESWLDHGGGGMSAKFAKVAGSVLIDEQIRSIFTNGDSVRQIHVFGHSHRPKEFEYRGIRYVHNPLGKPRERTMYMISPDVNFKQLWSTNGDGEIRSKPIYRLWDEEGGGVEMLHERLAKIRPGRYQRKK